MSPPILLFDPDPTAAGTLTLQLRRAGFEILMTTDGSVALTVAKAQEFASIVVVANLADAQMRNFLHELRGAAPNTWLMVISDPASDYARGVVRQLGGNATIDVPFTLSDLGRRLSALPGRGPHGVPQS
jgi:DNA-binding response OmpR family regulator